MLPEKGTPLEVAAEGRAKFLYHPPIWPYHAQGPLSIAQPHSGRAKKNGQAIIKMEEHGKNLRNPA